MLVLLPALPLLGLLFLLDDVVLAVHVSLRLNNALEFFGVFQRKAAYCFLESDLRIDLGLLEVKANRNSDMLDFCCMVFCSFVKFRCAISATTVSLSTIACSRLAVKILNCPRDLASTETS